MESEGKDQDLYW